MARGKDVSRLIAAIVQRGRWRRPLSAHQIALGAHLCWANAVSLLSDARLLACCNRDAIAFSITVLALEELAKPPLLWEMDPSADAHKWRAFWDKFSKHSPKQDIIGRYGKFLDAIGHDIYEVPMVESTVLVLDRLKQWGFYVDCVNDGFQSPDRISVEIRPILDLVFAAAEERADSFAKFHSTPEQSTWCFQHRHDLSAPWLSSLRSELEVGGVLLSYASKYSQSQRPDYFAFSGALEQLGRVLPAATIEGALATISRNCFDRARCKVLETAGKRAALMMKLSLNGLREDRRQEILRQFKRNGGRKQERPDHNGGNDAPP